MRINHNIAALNTYRQLSSANSAQSKSMEKLSSGLRINRAGDDAAGLAISEKMRGQIRGLDMASKNSQDAISLIQTAEGALNETHDILQRMRELAVQAANDTNTTSDREEIQKEINQMTSEINRIGNTTEFNTQKLLNGDKAATYTSKSKIEFDLTGMTAGTTKVMGLDVAFDTDEGTTAGNIKTAIEADAALKDKYTVTVAGNKVTIETKENGPSTGMTADLAGATGITSSAVTTTEGTKDDSGVLSFQIGANENQSLSLEINDMRAVALGISTADPAADAKLAVTDGTSSATTEQALSVLTHADAAATVTKIQSAIDKVSAERSKLGANQNRLEHTINNLGTSSENLTAAESRVRDVDYALAA
ncbi:flagellin [Pseudobacillus badius]|uniref:flagellin N-terminal helical domain-containing protein n=1 Tax=Bacillus badius TaxID=1455 RepID=UPI0007B06D01|nr:flagellin [Bacillus badius]KZO00153.1 flagellin [Bacillus badius]MED0668544.1 flagellin [Bacillus badius]OCS86315.1 flagellin [Bacillus badius]OVE52225.1 flagellin [Bacillus badius]TDW03942.1 flagellin [Bacillus badius]